MYDIHCHLIDGIDDGARDFEDCLNMCRAAVKEKIKHIVATPHYMKGVSTVSQSTLLNKIEILNNRLKQENINLTILPGMEVYVDPDLLKMYERGEIITLNREKYLLIEFSAYGMPSYIEHILFQLQLKGLKPIIAHPERCRPIIRNPYLVYYLIDNGCLIQVNSGSVEGMFGKEVKKTAHTLLKYNMVHVISTDNHSSYERMSQLRKCYNFILKKYGREMAEDLFINNPCKILKGEDIYMNEPFTTKI